MKKLLTAALLVGASVCIAAPAEAHYSRPSSAPRDSEVHSCRAISFAPMTDWGAGDIKAGNLSCRSARRLARQFSLRGQRPSSWSCQYRGRNNADGSNGQAHTDYRCRSGRRFITWMVT